MDRDRDRDAILLSVNHGDCAGLGVDDIDLVANRIHRKVCWIGANLQSPILAEIDEIEHGYGVGAAVTDVGKLAIAVGDVRKPASAAARGEEKERANSCSHRPRK